MVEKGGNWLMLYCKKIYKSFADAVFDRGEIIIMNKPIKVV
jgi:hypothetical protein